MSVRVKLFSAISVLVLFMGLAYFFSTQGYLRNNLPNIVPLAEIEKTNRWTELFHSSYIEYGNSWSAAQLVFQSLASSEDRNLQIVLYSAEGYLISQSTNAEVEKLLKEGLKKAVMADGRTVANLYYFDEQLAQSYQSRQNIYQEMYHVTIKTVAPIIIIALFIGLWLTRKLTSPLRSLTTAIERVGKGELNIALPITSHDEYGQITQALNRMAADLAQSEEIRKQLVADVAHELRTPLTILQGQLELIQLRGQNIAPETLLPMQDEVLRLNKLVNDLLQLSLAEAGKLSLEKQKTDLTELLIRLIERMRVNAEEKNIHINLISSLAPAEILVDPNRITQVFYNLIGNAIRYTPVGGQVTIQLTASPEIAPKQVQVSITDTGHGIPAEHLPHVFNRFYRVEDDRSRHSGGVGLGLTITKQLVQAHGGIIKVESTVGLGTKFIVILPVA